MLPNDFYTLPVKEAAKALLGQRLIRTLPDNTRLGGTIIETESYHENDPAAHSYGGRQTPRNAVMFGHPGYAYVYFTYGMHYCLNVVVRPEGEAAAVLIRAVEPLEGVRDMYTRRGSQHPVTNLCSGPAKLTQALHIGKELNGHNLEQPPLRLLPGEGVAETDIEATPRIGITRATDKLWRFYIRGNPHVSR